MTDFYQFEDTLPKQMDWCTIHWTGGTRTAGAVEYAKEFYNAIILPDATVLRCNPFDMNWRPQGMFVSNSEKYLRHAGEFNTRNIGVALLGMHDSEDGGITRNEFSEEEVYAMIRLCAATAFSQKLSADKFLPHSSILPMFDRGGGKWDVNWIPQIGHMNWKQARDWWQSQINSQLLRDIRAQSPSPIEPDEPILHTPTHLLREYQKCYSPDSWNSLIIRGLLDAHTAGRVPLSEKKE